MCSLVFGCELKRKYNWALMGFLFDFSKQFLIMGFLLGFSLQFHTKKGGRVNRDVNKNKNFLILNIV